MNLSASTFFTLSKQSIQGWQKDNATVWCAALAYFTVFSLGPLLFLIISIIGLIFTKTSSENLIYGQIHQLLGTNGSNMLETVVNHAKKPTSSVIGTIIGTITLILGAIGVFGQLQQMLNHIWGVTQKPKSGLWNLILSRLLNLSMVGVLTFLLLVSTVASSVISGMGTYASHLLPLSPVILEVINFIISLIVTAVLFAFILKVLPDVQVKWGNIWIGAIVTALLFTVGKTVIGIYIGHSGISSEYGAAASLIILLLWVYYSSQIVFLGAEFTKAYTLKREGKITPSEFSVITTEQNKKTYSHTPTKGEKAAVITAKKITENIIDKATDIKTHRYKRKKKKR